MIRILTEFAYEKQKILNDISYKRDEYFEHMIKLYYWNNTEYYDHWTREIHGLYKSTPKCISNNKYLKAMTLYKEIFLKWADCIEDWLPVTIEDLNYLNQDLPDIIYKKDDYIEIYNFISKYSEWLSEELSKHGMISIQSVRSKLDELLYREEQK